MLAGYRQSLKGRPLASPKQTFAPSVSTKLYTSMGPCRAGGFDDRREERAKRGSTAALEFCRWPTTRCHGMEVGSHVEIHRTKRQQERFKAKQPLEIYDKRSQFPGPESSCNSRLKGSANARHHNFGHVSSARGIVAMRPPRTFLNVASFISDIVDCSRTNSPPTYSSEEGAEVRSFVYIRSSGTSVVDIELPRSAPDFLVVQADGSSQVKTCSKRRRSMLIRLLVILAGTASIFGAVFGSVSSLP